MVLFILYFLDSLDFLWMGQSASIKSKVSLCPPLLWSGEQKIDYNYGKLKNKRWHHI